MFRRRTVRFRRLEVVALRFRGAEFLRFAAGLVRLRCAGFRLAFMARFAALRCAFEPKWSFCLRLSLRATLAFLPARFRAGFAMIVRTVETAIAHYSIPLHGYISWRVIVAEPEPATVEPFETVIVFGPVLC